MADLPEQHRDASARLKQTSNDKHAHPINLGVHPGLSKRSDFETEGVEVPARAERERINPADAAKQRRAGLIDVTEIRSPSGSNSHVPEPSPKKL
jgi:hypothetical protein